MGEALNPNGDRLSVIQAVDALQEINPEVVSYDSVVYDRTRTLDLLRTLATGNPEDATVRDDFIHETVRGIANTSSIAYNSVAPRFFDYTFEKEDFSPIFGTPDYDYFLSDGFTELKEVATLMEPAKTSWDYAEREHVFTLEDIVNNTAEVLSYFNGARVLSIFTDLGMELTGSPLQLVQAEFLEALLYTGVLPEQYQSYPTQLQWMTEEAGSQKIYEAARVWLSGTSNYRHKILESLAQPGRFVDFIAERNGEHQRLFVDSYLPLGRYVSANPEHTLQIHGADQEFVTKRGAKRPGRRMSFRHGKTTRSTVGIAINPEAPHTGSTIATDTLQIEIRGNTLLTALSIISKQPELLTQYGLFVLGFQERVFALAADPSLRESILSHGRA